MLPTHRNELAAPETSRHRFRKLRIAWSVGWGLVAALLIVLWLRSYWTLDCFTRVNIRKIQTTIGSQSGSVYFAHFNAEIAYKGTGNPYTSHGWTFTSRETYVVPTHEFVWKRGQSSLNIELPYWFPAIIAVLIGAFLWLPW
jgi:hypothetical protein